MARYPISANQHIACGTCTIVEVHGDACFTFFIMRKAFIPLYLNVLREPPTKLGPVHTTEVPFLSRFPSTDLPEFLTCKAIDEGCGTDNVEWTSNRTAFQVG